jgi:hypothetical protein
VDAAAAAQALREFASRIRNLRPTLWTEPKRYYSDRSKLARHAFKLADEVAKTAWIAPSSKHSSTVRVERVEGKYW